MKTYKIHIQAQYGSTVRTEIFETYIGQQDVIHLQSNHSDEKAQRIGYLFCPCADKIVSVFIYNF